MNGITQQSETKENIDALRRKLSAKHRSNPDNQITTIIGYILISIILLMLVSLVDSYLIGLVVTEAVGLITSQGHSVMILGIPVNFMIGAVIAIFLVSWLEEAIYLAMDADKYGIAKNPILAKAFAITSVPLCLAVATLEGTAIQGFRLIKNPTISILFAVMIPLLLLMIRAMSAYKIATFRIRGRNILSARKDQKKAYLESIEKLNRYQDIFMADLNAVPAENYHRMLLVIDKFLSGEISAQEYDAESKKLREPPILILPNNNDPNPKNTTGSETKEPKSPSTLSIVKSDAFDAGGKQGPGDNGRSQQGTVRTLVIAVIAGFFLAISLFISACSQSFGGQSDKTVIIVATDVTLSMNQSQEMRCIDNFFQRMSQQDNVKIDFMIFGSYPKLLYTAISPTTLQEVSSDILKQISRMKEDFREKTDIVAALNAVKADLTLQIAANPEGTSYLVYIITDLADDPSGSCPEKIPDDRLKSIGNLLAELSQKAERVVVFQANPQFILQYGSYIEPLLRSKTLVIESSQPGTDLCRQLSLKDSWSPPIIKY